MIRIPKQISENMKLSEIVDQPDLADIQSNLVTTEHSFQVHLERSPGRLT